MRRDDFLKAFEQLGHRFPEPVRLVLAGGSAMILMGYVDRDTADGDAIETTPKLSTLQRYLDEVADELGVRPDWLNDAVRAHRDLLPPDFPDRLQPIGVFGNLTVAAIGRQDLILMKIAAGRARDIDDLKALQPTTEEIAFVAGQLERISQTSPHRALRVDLYLREHDVGHAVRPPSAPDLMPASRGGDLPPGNEEVGSTAP